MKHQNDMMLVAACQMEKIADRTVKVSMKNDVAYFNSHNRPSSVIRNTPMLHSKTWKGSVDDDLILADSTSNKTKDRN